MFRDIKKLAVTSILTLVAVTLLMPPWAQQLWERLTGVRLTTSMSTPGLTRATSPFGSFAPSLPLALRNQP